MSTLDRVDVCRIRLLIKLQSDNAAQISDYGVTCIVEQILETDPISITERLVAAIVAAAAARNVDPSLTTLWQQFLDKFKIYKRVQRKIDSRYLLPYQ